MKYLKKLKIELIKGEYKNQIKGQVRGPEEIFNVFKDIKNINQETLIGVYLTDDLEVRAYDVLTVGGADVALVVPEEIFEHAIILKSRIFILIHNHPAGDPSPSEQDRRVIEALKTYSKNLNRTFLDFIIVGDLGDTKKKDYWSMFEEADGGEYTLGALH